MPSKDEFEANLARFGFQPTDAYTDDGQQRWWRKQDGEMIMISVWNEYPSAYLDWLLDEWRVGNITAYKSPF